MQLSDHATLAPATSADVLALAIRASTQDGVRPLSEQTVLALRRLPAEGQDEEPMHHVVALADPLPGSATTALQGYAGVDLSGATPSVELVVDPDQRRRGVGSALLQRVTQLWPSAHLWAHGDLPAARALAQDSGLGVVRTLLQMARPLSGEWADLPERELPSGFSVRPFHVGADEDEWLAVNARAFADHPEQGRTTLADLHERQSEPWFDPAGFLLVHEDDDQGRPRLAAFHWTKVESATPGSSTPADGEVYVVGVDPAYQGRGLGLTTTVLGLRHLRSCGLDRATLYVEGDNAAALATYRRLGFEQSAVDVQYAAPAADAAG